MGGADPEVAWKWPRSGRARRGTSKYNLSCTALLVSSDEGRKDSFVWYAQLYGSFTDPPTQTLLLQFKIRVVLVSSSQQVFEEIMYGFIVTS